MNLQFSVRFGVGLPFFMKTINMLAKQAFDELDTDILDRRGLKWEWAKIDNDVMEGEIRLEWEKIIASKIQKVEDSYALALAKHVPSKYWADTITEARKNIND